MLNKVKNGIVMSALGLALMVSSSVASAASGTGLVTYFSYYANYYTLLVSAGGVSCGVTSGNMPPENIAGAVAILASAKASGRNVSISCDGTGYFWVSM